MRRFQLKRQSEPLFSPEAFVALFTKRNLELIGESLLALAFAIAINTWLNSADPLGTTYAFPWIILIPAVFTLRYGSLAGLVQMLILLLAWLAFNRFVGVINPVFPKQFFLGGLVLCLLLGQFSDGSMTSNLRIKQANGYLEDRLRSLTRTHFLLRLSHQRLEQELLVKPVTLRDSLDAIIPFGNTEHEPFGKAQELLHLLVQSCEVESATVFACRQGLLQSESIAHVGERSTLNLKDALVSKAISEKGLIHVRSEQASLFSSEYLVAAPIQASSGELLGLVVVQDLPFLALNHENMQLMAVMLGFYADTISASSVIQPMHVVFPSCPADFALELIRVKRLYDQARIESSLVAFKIPRTQEGTNVLEFLVRSRRQSDFFWEMGTVDSFIHIVLMPMAGHAAVVGLLDRLEEALKKRFELDFESAKIATFFKAIDRVEVIWALDDLIKLCKHKAQTQT